MVTALSAIPSSFTPSMIAFASTTSSFRPSLAVRATLLLSLLGVAVLHAMDAHDIFEDV
jgi:hypothetical protein